MTALRNALSEVKSDIKVVSVRVKSDRRPNVQRQTENSRPKQFINGQEVKWHPQNENGHYVPYIQTKDYYVEFPSKPEDVQLREGVKGATYNKQLKRVEFTGEGGKMVRFTADAKHEPLPMPRFMSDLERIEDIFEIDFDTGEVDIRTVVDILPEQTHWRLRLEEFERQQKRAGVSEKVLRFRLERYMKNLHSTRGLTIQQIADPIPQSVLDAIEFSEAKLRMK